LEEKQKSLLRISQEHIVVLKSAITSFNITMQKVDRNERILTENLRLNKMVVDEINEMHTQVDSVMMMINENIQQIQRN